MTENLETENKPDTVDTLITDKPALDFTNGKPEGFPDEFWDAENKTPVVDKMYEDWQRKDKIAKDLRVKLGKGEFEGKAPDDIKEYTLELDEKLKPLVADDDPIVETLRKSAKEAGMPKEMFNKLLVPAIAELARIKGEEEKPLTQEEIDSIRQEKIKPLGPSGQKIVDACKTFIDQMKANGTLSEAESVAAKNMVFDADSARVMNKFRTMFGNKDDVPLDLPTDDSASRKDVEDKMAKALVANDEPEYQKYSAMLAKMNN